MRNLVWLVLVSLMCFSFAVPTALSIEINSGDDYTNDTSVTLALSATGAENCSLSNDDSSWSTPFSYTTSKTWDLDSGDGSKTVYFRCISNNETNWSSSVNDDINLDETAPDISSMSPTSSSVTDRTPEISADVSDDGSGVDETSIVLKVDDDTVTHDYSSGEVSYTPSSDLDFGSHDVELTVSDEAGNTAVESWDFTIASEGVGFENEEPEDGSWTLDDRPDISVDLVDTGSGINESTLTFEFDGTDVTDDEDVDYSSGTYSYDPPSLDDDNYTVRVCAEDNSGEESCFEWSFGVDTTAPEVSLLNPDDGDVVTSVYEISAYVEDEGSGVNEDRIFLELNGVDVSNSLDYDDGDVVFEPSIDLTGGTYDVEIWAEDEVGNDVNVEWSFSIPSTAPSLSDKTPSDESTISDVRPEISIEIDDPGSSGIDSSSLMMYLDDDLVDADYSGGVFYYTPSSDLSDGEHTIEVIAENNNGERSTAEWSFSIDTTAPGAPKNFKAVQTTTGVKLTWTAPTESFANYEIYSSTSAMTSIAGRNPITEPDSGATQYTHETTGKRYYAIVAIDSLGNPSSAAFASPCAEYKSGSWNDYACCIDEDCDLGYYCNSTTHECNKLPDVVTEDEAEDAIEDAEAIIEAKRETNNVTAAENLLNSAQNSLTAGNYEEAERLAHLARDEALSAPSLDGSDLEAEEEDGKKQLPCCPAFILLAVLVFSALMARK